MRVLVAMSGGVDSSVAAALALRDGHEVVGVTLKLWGGPVDQGCCSVSDVEDARRVADGLGIDHHVFNYAEEFNASVVEPYVAAHATGRTPNPCVECNRHLKFDLLYRRAAALGFDAVATGHHAQVRHRPDGRWRLVRGADAAKDQSYVLYMLGQDQLARTLLPVGSLQKSVVRELAAQLGLRTAAKPDSQDVCFISAGAGRAEFLGARIPLTPARLVDGDGREVGEVPAIQLVTIGQRKGLGLAGGDAARFVVGIDRAAATVTVGPPTLLSVASQPVVDFVWADETVVPRGGDVAALVQCSAHGAVAAATVVVSGEAEPGEPAGSGRVVWDAPQRRVAPGQSLVFYDPEEPDQVIGGCIAR